MDQFPLAPPSSSYSSTPENSEEALDKNSGRLEGVEGGEEGGSSNGSDTYESATTTATVLRLPGNQDNSSRSPVRDSGSTRGWSIVKRQSAQSTSTSKNSQRNSTRSLIKQERARLDSSHSHYYYNKHALQESDHISIEASTTGNDPLIGFSSIFVDPKDIASPRASSTVQNAKSFFREDFTSSCSGDRANVTRKGVQSSTSDESYATRLSGYGYKNHQKTTIHSPSGTIIKPEVPNNDFPSIWTIFCRLVTVLVLPSILRLFGLTSKKQQEAWREKIGLNFIIVLITALVGFCTLGLSRLVCNDTAVRIHYSAIPSDSLVIHGRIFNISDFNHPPVISPTEGFHGLAVSKSLGATDGSLLFQNVNSQCKGLILPDKRYTNVPMDKFGRVPWYFPCTTLTFDGRFIEPPIQKLANPSRYNITLDFSTQDPQYGCHLHKRSRQLFYARMHHYGNVYYNWEDIDSSPRNLIVYHGDVIDLDRLKLLIPMRWRMAPELKKFILPNKLLKSHTEAHPRQRDLSLQMVSSKRARKAARCLLEIAKVGVVDTDTLGCITSSLVLIVSVVFICSIVVIKFLFAVYFEWFLSWGTERSWNDQVRGKLFSDNKGKNYSESTHSKSVSEVQPTTTEGLPLAVTTTSTDSENDPDLQLLMVENRQTKLKYVICLVTVYSETAEGLRQTLNGLVETDYPHTHKLLLVICDGMVTGSENNYTTPDVVLSMMEDFIYAADTVKERSYIAVASGAQRINMAKVYCGYYQYQSDNSMEERPKVPMIAIIKCGLQEEARTSSKPGNRGKRDSQIILMSFLQKVMFEERMTDLENEMYLGMYRLMNGSKPDIFEAVLMVDADTKVYPDSLRHMVRCLDRDSSIMGLCGETKIENKQASWVTMIQVFEYFISHHYTKSFESVFGGVTCLPGCFCMYRIKAPKGPDGYWVPILANPDVVERYSMNIVDSLHRKNLLLLGEDRYLSTLMLKTFSQRKQVFVPQAKCKTVVPTEFKVLLDQRRRWINSTIHNLLELLLVRDLCGVFCISMQFVVFIELMGTVTLPAALVFTIYLFISATVNSELPIIPITLLTLILGIPAVLIVVTGHKWVYLGWMFVYLLSLPVWNFILPLNACKANPPTFQLDIWKCTNVVLFSLEV
jgi:chitin synthase